MAYYNYTGAKIILEGDIDELPVLGKYKHQDGWGITYDMRNKKLNDNAAVIIIPPELHVIPNRPRLFAIPTGVTWRSDLSAFIVEDLVRSDTLKPKFTPRFTDINDAFNEVISQVRYITAVEGCPGRHSKYITDNLIRGSSLNTLASWVVEPTKLHKEIRKIIKEIS